MGLGIVNIIFGGIGAGRHLVNKLFFLIFLIQNSPTIVNSILLHGCASRYTFPYNLPSSNSLFYSFHRCRISACQQSCAYPPSTIFPAKDYSPPSDYLPTGIFSRRSKLHYLTTHPRKPSILKSAHNLYVRLQHVQLQPSTVVLRRQYVCNPLSSPKTLATFRGLKTISSFTISVLILELA